MTRPLTIFLPHCSDFLTDNRPHGDGLVAYGFVRHLAERGHNLIAATPEADLQKPLPPNVELHVLGRAGGRGMLARLRYMARVRRLYTRVNRAQTIDVIHQLNPVYTGVSLALLGAKAPVLLGPYISRWPDDPDAITAGRVRTKRLLTACNTLLAGLQQRAADSVLLTTEAARDRIHPGLCVESKIHLLPHGLDTKQFAPETATVGKGTRQEILFLSNVHRRKGIFDLLDAFALLSQEFPHSVLTIAGDGDDCQTARAYAAALPGADRVYFVGRQSRAEAVAQLQRCTLFCLPSHGEPFGMAAAEAMGCGKPVVATRTGGLGHLVQPDAGLTVPPGDVPALAAALRALLSSPALCAEMGAGARRRALEELSWERVIDRLEATYQALVSPHLAPPKISHQAKPTHQQKPMMPTVSSKGISDPMSHPSQGGSHLAH